jgi:hypothetical protein
MDDYLGELARQCATATQLDRLCGTEQLAVLRWLIDGGYMTLSGKELMRPRQLPHPIANRNDGSPIFAKDADFSTHEPLTLKRNT